MNEKSPCMGCAERFIACSDRCPKDARGEYGYKAWKAQYHAQQKHLEAHKNRWQTPWSASGGRIDHRNLRFGKDGFKRGGYQ